jgi:hypothetical protein
VRTFLATAVLVASLASPALAGGRHDFDFEIGSWTITPGAYRHVVRELWSGATIAQLIVQAPVRRVRGSLLSVYDPNRRVWNIYWADANDGSLSKPLTGGFRNGIGTFTGADTRDGRPILVRIVYDRIAASSFRTVQSESSDEGRTWMSTAQRSYTRLRNPG